MATTTKTTEIRTVFTKKEIEDALRDYFDVPEKSSIFFEIDGGNDDNPPLLTGVTILSTSTETKNEK